MLLRQLLFLVFSSVTYRRGGYVDAVDYLYITPSESSPPNPGCPSGYPCHTLDHYARNLPVYFNGTAGANDVTMVFMSGVHKSSRCFNLSGSSYPPQGGGLNITMTSSGITITEGVVIQLEECDFTLASLNHFMMSNLTIDGMKRFGVILDLNKAVAERVIVDQMTFIGTALALVSHFSPSPTVTIMNCNFTTSLLDMSFIFTNANVFILRSTFTSSSHQSPMISMCIVRSLLDLFVDSVYTTNRSDIELNAPQLAHFYCHSLFLSAEVAIDLVTGELDVTVVNSTFSRRYGTAIYFQLGTSLTGTALSAVMENSSFYHHDHGAVVLKFIQVISVNMTLEKCTFANNTYFGTDGSSGVQVIYPLQGTPPEFLYSHVIKFQDCTFRHNENQIVLLYKSKNVTFANCTFVENTGTSIVAFHTERLVLTGEMNFIRNTAYRGAGLVLTESTLYVDYDTTITFYGNKASNKGGAILVEGNGIAPGDSLATTTRCFYQVLRKNGLQKFRINFTDNYALSGGYNIYGAPLASYCISDEQDSRSIQELESHMFYFHSKTVSSISSDPKRVCLCDSNGEILCDDIESIFIEGYALYPGEKFELLLAVVGMEFGTVTGTVQANLTQSGGIVTPDYHPVTDVAQCVKIAFSVLHSSPSRVRMYLTIQDRYAPYYNRDIISDAIDAYRSGGIAPTELLNVPVVLDISLLPCPAGFLLIGNPPKCDCYPQIADDVTCEIINGTGFVSRNAEVWIGIDIDGENDTLFSRSCPFEYCNFTSTLFELSQTETQCGFHHAGRLCGGCAEGYSLALGSSHCLLCTNNDYIALILFFIVAGPILVLIIHVLNLTVTQGTLNGIVLYVNIVWTYQEVLFPRRSTVLLPLRIFLAWFNLDFGIESCFAVGLDAFWKTWLQFVFPLYLWSIEGVIVIACRHSIRLTNVFGERAVPVLATLFLLSYLKLFRAFLEISVFTTLTVYPSTSSIVVWSLDGNLLYGRYPHIFLLLVAIAVMVLIFIPCTLVIFLVQWLRKVSHLKLFKWVNGFNPIFDACLAPLNDKHHYWVGVLLFLRGALLINFTLTVANFPTLNLFLLLVAVTILFFYMLYFRIYKSQLVLFLESLSFMNLILLAGGGLYVISARAQGGTFIISTANDSLHNIAILTNISISAALVQFLGVLLKHVMQTIKDCHTKKQQQLYENIGVTTSCSVQYNDENAEYRDSILN